jgi:type IV secretory pathway ATPase VirB11/archaellum biosynthesis ATPase
MAARPDMIVQFAQHLGRDVGERFGVRDVRVTADVRAALNGREFQQLIDPAANLTEVELSPFTTADYIEPLRTPLS